MKIIHCADLHLNSRMNTHLTPDKARERNAELLITFNNMIGFALEREVDAIIIAGDLYDRKSISATAANTFLGAVKNNPDITFFYLKGNHDAESLLDKIGNIPSNLKMFDESWTSYILKEGDKGNITVTGVELNSDNSSGIYNSLSLRADDFNIVVLHGQESAVKSKDKAENISIKDLKNRYIDYLALGHIHSYKEAELDARGIYCYPGCLEGRGFDECGEHGFVYIEIDEKNMSMTREFIPIAGRNLFEVEVDITDCENTYDISSRIRTALAVYDSKDMIKVVLTGEVDVECDKNTDFLTKQFENDFYFIKISDATGLKINYDDFMHDMSLKGEFVRTVMADGTMTEEDKMAVIRYGILALKGEEIQ